MTTISPIKYEVEIHEPLSTPVPMPPSMLSSEALVIWMFRIAMNEPIMAASTAIQVAALARLGSATGRSDVAADVAGVEIERLFDMARPSGNQLCVLCLGRDGRVRGRRGRTCCDRRDHGHAGPQRDRRLMLGIERDLDGNALHHLGEVAGGVVG